jgi:hypothetical protein
LLEQEGTKASHFYHSQLAKLQEWIGPSIPPPSLSPSPLPRLSKLESASSTDPTIGSSSGSTGGEGEASTGVVVAIPPLQRLERWITRQSITPTPTTRTTATDVLGIELPATNTTPAQPPPLPPTEPSTLPVSSPRSTLADQVVEEDDDDDEEELDLGDQTTIPRKDPYEIGMEVLQVFSFVVANVIALRQSLIRYDAFARTYDGLKILRGGIWVADDDDDDRLFGMAVTLSDPVAKDAIQRAKAMLASSSYASESSLLESVVDQDDSATVGQVVADRRTLFGRLCATPQMTAATACGGGRDGLMKEDTATTAAAASGGTTLALRRKHMDNKLRDRMTVMFHLGPLMTLQSTFLNQLTRPHEAISVRHQFYLRCSDLNHHQDDELTPEAEEALSAQLAAYDSAFCIPHAVEYSKTFGAQLEALGLILDKASTDPAATFSDPLVVRDQFVVCSTSGLP